MSPLLGVGPAVTLGCLLEVTAPKVGNVSRLADFEDLTFSDFLVSGVAVGEVFSASTTMSIGSLIATSVEAMLRTVRRNTHLGTILLLAPLSKLPTEPADWPHQIQAILASLTSDDARDTYAAIRRVSPGGMGSVEPYDLNGPAPTSLIDAMRNAESWDSIARQYSRGYRDMWETVLPLLRESVRVCATLDDAIVLAQLKILAAIPDSLIARKCGSKIAAEASLRATRTLEQHRAFPEAYLRQVSELDFWMRSDGHRRNPGTTADLIAAGLYLMLRQGELPLSPPNQTLSVQ